MQRIRFPADHIRAAAGNHIVQQILVAHSRPPEMPAFAFLIAAVIDGHGAAVVQIFSAVLDGVHVLPSCVFSSIPYFRQKYNKTTIFRNKIY